MEFYYTPPGSSEQHGPFVEEKILQWYRHSFFPSSIRIRAALNGAELFNLTLRELVTRNGSANPFIHVPVENRFAEPRVSNPALAFPLWRQVSRLEGEVSAMRDELSDRARMREIYALQDKLASHDKQLVDVVAKADDFQNQNSALSSKISILQQDFKDYLSKFEDLEDMVSCNSESIDEMCSKIGEIKKSISSTKSELVKLSADAKQAASLKELVGQTTKVEQKDKAKEKSNSGDEGTVKEKSISSVSSEPLLLLQPTYVKLDASKCASTSPKLATENSSVAPKTVELHEPMLVARIVKEGGRIPLLHVNKNPAYVDHSDLNLAMQRKRLQSFHRTKFDEMFSSRLSDEQCLVCPTKPKFATAVEVFEHVISVQHLRWLRVSVSPAQGYGMEDLDFWEWLIVRASRAHYNGREAELRMEEQDQKDKAGVNENKKAEVKKSEEKEKSISPVPTDPLPVPSVSVTTGTSRSATVASVVAPPSSTSTLAERAAAHSTAVDARLRSLDRLPMMTVNPHPDADDANELREWALELKYLWVDYGSFHHHFSHRIMEVPEKKCLVCPEHETRKDCNTVGTAVDVLRHAFSTEHIEALRAAAGDGHGFDLNDVYFWDDLIEVVHPERREKRLKEEQE